MASTPHPKLSVIVPVYNVEKHLPRCLDSLAAQTISDIEFILVDDCSSDGSCAIAEEYVARSNNWTLIKHEANKGLSAARNSGIACAHGEYIGFVDSDDWVEPTMFETLLRTAEHADCDIAQVQYELRSEPGKKTVQQAERLKVITGLDALEEMLLQEKYAVWFMIYRRTLFHEEGHWFPEGLTCEDRVFNSMFLPRAHSVSVSNRVEYYYFQNLGSLSHSGLTSRGLDLLEADKRMLSNIEALDDQHLLELACDRAAKGSYSLLVKWARFGTTDPSLDEGETLRMLRSDFERNYPRLMKSHLSLAKKAVAWQLRYCAWLLKLEFALYNAIALH